MAKYIAVDLGASNGRVIVGDLAGIEVTNRFATRNEEMNGEVCWDLPYIYTEIKKGIKAAFSQFGSEIVSIGIDTWGVDYGLLDSHGSLITLPYHYRDSRTDGMIAEVSDKLGKERIFMETGIAFQPFNTLYQLAAMQKQRPETFAAARHYLSFPDLITFWLTGVMVNEITHASTTQLFNPEQGDWSWELIDGMGFPRELFGRLVPSGTVVGSLTPALQNELGSFPHVKVVAVGSHDTASAVAAVPAAQGEDFLYLSSGTWSLLGVESQKPVITRDALNSGFTNEVAVNGSIRFLKNIMGMWIQHECVRYWETMGEVIGWKELDEQTLACQDFKAGIDPDDQRYLKPNSHLSLMTDRIREQCMENGLPVPQSKGEYMVAIYRGLAKAYAKAIDNLQTITGRKYSALHIIGGGCKNEILDQWAADETGLAVHAGPVEATALGNIIVQGVAMGTIDSLQTGRDLIRRHQQVHTFFPESGTKR
ncbi:MAG: rhamnulokinase [Spirochaetae bacterium HGW-Spirochaetae-8]|jgi:rhamnulokinase|nr:MAG: rhamnulokinase [Spirochaetae bacterium HGW-Spirochaetae-8]